MVELGSSHPWFKTGGIAPDVTGNSVRFSGGFRFEDIGDEF
jgi:hypothetical protein